MKKPMPDHANDIPALVASRLCHDLISPIGAIGNGLELLSLAGLPEGPEFALLRDSVESANARVRFFRIAFGRADGGQPIARAEILSILEGLTRSGRIALDWLAEGAAARDELKLVFLLIQCLESAMPHGGRIIVEREGGQWHLTARSERLSIEPGTWEMLVGGKMAEGVPPSLVHFLLVGECARAMGRAVKSVLGEEIIALSF